MVGFSLESEPESSNINVKREDLTAIRFLNHPFFYLDESSILAHKEHAMLLQLKRFLI